MELREGKTGTKEAKVSINRRMTYIQGKVENAKMSYIQNRREYLRLMTLNDE